MRNFDNIKRKVNGKAVTSIGIGGDFELYVPTEVEEAEELIRAKPELWLLGGGTKLLIPDKGSTPAVTLNRLNEVQQIGGSFYCEAGATLSAVAQLAAKKGYTGLEFACGIPGTVGGALHGNAGAFGSSIFDLVDTLTVLIDGEEITLSGDAVKSGYRKGTTAIALCVRLQLKKGNQSDISDKIRYYTEYRSATQPRKRSFGCVFKNPKGGSAAQYIERTGLKGKQIGGAMLSAKHCNFIINTGNATSSDVLKLVELIEKSSEVPLEREFITAPLG